MSGVPTECEQSGLEARLLKQALPIPIPWKGQRIDVLTSAVEPAQRRRHELRACAEASCVDSHVARSPSHPFVDPGDRDTPTLLVDEHGVGVLGEETVRATLDPRPRPIYTRWWFWTAIGGVVATGATLGVVLNPIHPSAIPGNSTPQSVSTIIVH